MFSIFLKSTFYYQFMLIFPSRHGELDSYFLAVCLIINYLFINENKVSA